LDNYSTTNSTYTAMTRQRYRQLTVATPRFAVAESRRKSVSSLNSY